MAGSITDISERKEAEALVRESEERFRAIVDNSPNAIVLKDLEGRIQLTNKRHEEWFGEEQMSRTGKTAHDFLSGERADHIAAAESRVVAENVTLEWEQDARFNDGVEHRLAVVKFPVYDGDHKAIGVGTVQSDVTEERKMESQLRQAQKMEAVGQLTGGVAHDFNNLLSVTLGNAEILSEQLGDGKGGNHANAIIHAATRGAELTHRLLSFSRQQTLAPKSIDIHSLVVGMTDMLSRTLGETIEIVTNDASDLWLVKADPGQLENAILNLAINARDAMPNGGSLILDATNAQLGDGGTAEKFSVAPGDYVELSVTDTGAGMSREVLEHVFEPFFTTKGVGEGSGLGLSMVYGFAAQSGGFVDIESQADQGTTVRLYLPRATDQVAITGADKKRTVQIPSARVTVLVVEDEPDVRQIVVAILSEIGCTVIEVGDGRAAMSYFEEHRDIDVLFADVVLPGGVSGPDIAARARCIMPGLKVVFTSGYPDGDANDLAADDGHNWFIRKPYRKSELAALFDEVLQT